MNNDSSKLIVEKEQLEKGMLEIGEIAIRFWREGAVWDIKSGHHDIVTEADREVEKALISLIEKEFPDAKILGEESGGEDLGDDFWVIDPIDGTTVFSTGGRDWCIAISRIGSGQFDFAMVLVPLGTEGAELYYAKRGFGAYVDEIWKGEKRTRKLGVSKTDKIEHATIATNQEEIWNEDKEVINLTKHTRGTRILGSTIYWVIGVANGIFDIGVTGAKKSWDLIGLLFVEEAGGKVTKRDGSEDFDFVTKGKDAKNDFLATNGVLHEEAIRTLDNKSGV